MTAQEWKDLMREYPQIVYRPDITMDYEYGIIMYFGGHRSGFIRHDATRQDVLAEIECLQAIAEKPSPHYLDDERIRFRP